jgi:Thiol-disulfide isomerase and thioredoxins
VRGTSKLAVAVIVMALGACDSSTERFRPLVVGEAVPAYAVRTLGGDSARVGAGEQLTLLNLWATWCGPCEKEFPDLERLRRDYEPKGLRVLAVSVDLGDDAKVREFARNHGAGFTIGRDPDGSAQRLFQTVGLPETFLIASDGTLLWRHFGALSPGAVTARREIDRAMGGSGRAE